MLRWIFLSGTHLAALAIGFALGVYLLPILTAPKGPDKAALEAMSQAALFKATFKRELKGSDFLHWGEGSLSVSADKIVHDGELAPGPDYKLYLVKEFVEDEEQFLKVKDQSTRIGDVKPLTGSSLTCRTVSTSTSTPPPSSGAKPSVSSSPLRSIARHCSPLPIARNTILQTLCDDLAG